MSGRELPEGWGAVPLNAICNRVTDGTHQSPKFEADGVPFLVISNIISGEINWKSVKKWISHDTYTALTARVRPERGDVLYTAVGSYGTAVAVHDDRPFAFQRHIAHIKPDSSVVDADFLSRWLNCPEARRKADAVARGVAQKTVTLGELAEFEVPLAPLPEQRRIVEKIEALTARSRRAREALDSLPALIDRYRQSILTAAFRGDLTAEWRENRTLNSASAWLREILAKRESLWPRFGRGSHRPAFPPERSLEVPDNWSVTTLDALLVGIQGGKNFRCEERPPQQNEAGIIKISAVTWGEFDEEESKTVLDRSALAASTLIEPQDFLFSRANTLELVGSCVIVSDVNKELYLSDKVLRFHFADDLAKRWVLWFLRSPAGRKQIEETSSGNQLSMRNIGQDSIRQIAIPLPPAAEMSFIISAIERRVETFRTLRRTATEQMSCLDTLDQSILAKAFRGKLVPQDPNDEPASVLLERTRAERAVAGAAPRRGRRRNGA